jgi:hypothetical protein
MRIQLTVFFEGEFWVGLFEREDAGQVQAARVVFGAEPTSPELLNWLRLQFDHLEFSRATAAAGPSSLAPNPKRALREAKRATLTRGVTGAAQEAMRVELETRKLERRVTTKAERAAADERKRALRREKQKARHRGRA